MLPTYHLLGEPFQQPGEPFPVVYFQGLYIAVSFRGENKPHELLRHHALSRYEDFGAPPPLVESDCSLAGLLGLTSEGFQLPVTDCRSVHSWEFKGKVKALKEKCDNLREICI